MCNKNQGCLKKLLKFQQRYNKNQICLEKIEDKCNNNQGCIGKIFEKLSISITKIKLAYKKFEDSNKN